MIYLTDFRIKINAPSPTPCRLFIRLGSARLGAPFLGAPPRSVPRRDRVIHGWLMRGETPSRSRMLSGAAGAGGLACAACPSRAAAALIKARRARACRRKPNARFILGSPLSISISISTIDLSSLHSDARHTRWLHPHLNLSRNQCIVARARASQCISFTRLVVVVSQPWNSFRVTPYSFSFSLGVRLRAYYR